MSDIIVHRSCHTQYNANDKRNIKIQTFIGQCLRFTSVNHITICPFLKYTHNHLLYTYMLIHTARSTAINLGAF